MKSSPYSTTSSSPPSPAPSGPSPPASRWESTKESITTASPPSTTSLPCRNPYSQDDSASSASAAVNRSARRSTPWPTAEPRLLPTDREETHQVGELRRVPTLTDRGRPTLRGHPRDRALPSRGRRYSLDLESGLWLRLFIATCRDGHPSPSRRLAPHHVVVGKDRLPECERSRRFPRER